MASPLRTTNLSPHETGYRELFRLLEISRTTPQSLQKAHNDLESIPETLAQRMIALGIQLLREHLELPKIQNNLAHVEDQLLRPVIEDGDELSSWFGIHPLKLRLLVVLHDLGKVDIPEPIKTSLQELFPKDYVGREILTHEFASMHWIEQLGKQLTLDPSEILALQTLIANHNFGPNLCLPQHKHLRTHWWPTQFRNRVMPKLQEIGVNLDNLYEKSEDGQHQYHHCEDEVYASLLAVYDRAIANQYNNFGLETWQKFAEQDYAVWLSSISDTHGPGSCFHAKGITEKMEQATQWAEIEIKTLWEILSQRHVLNARRREFQLKKFPPYQRQILGVFRLKKAIKTIQDLNKEEPLGALKYRTSENELFRVEENLKEKSRLYWWNDSTKAWDLVAKDESPIKLFFEMLKNDF